MRNVVVHLAAAVGVKLIVERPCQDHRNPMSRNAVNPEPLKKRKTRSHCSTSEVYGKNTNGSNSMRTPISSSPHTKGRWSYAAPSLDEFLALLLLGRKKSSPSLWPFV